MLNQEKPRRLPLSPVDSWVRRGLGLDPDEELTREALDRYQLDRLSEIVALARRHSPFYRDRLAGLASLPFQTRADLDRLPFTSEDDLRRNPEALLCVSQDEVARVVTLQTSGTTQNPKRLFFAAEDLARTLEYFAIGMTTFADPGSRVLICLPGITPDGVGDLLARSLGRVGMDGFIHGPVADPEKAIREAESLKIDTLVGVPVQVLAMARHPEAGRLADGRLKAVLLNMDHMPLAIRTALERTWGADVYDHYGMTEMGLGGGVQCRARQGYHPRDLDLLFEVIDPATGRIVEDGQPGEVVFSTLTRKTMPLIRYRTGDWGRWLVEPCSCGGRLRTLGKVTGRVRGGIPLSGSGLLTMAALDEALFPIPGLLDFQAEIQDLETGASLELTVWAAPGANRQAVLDDAARALADLPAVQSALAKPGFHLAAPVAGPESGPDRGSAKRRIIDCRRNMPDLI